MTQLSVLDINAPLYDVPSEPNNIFGDLFMQQVNLQEIYPKYAEANKNPSSDNCAIILGDNFEYYRTKDLFAYFGDIESTATIIDNKSIKTVIPNHPEGQIILRVGPKNWMRSQGIRFNFCKPEILVEQKLSQLTIQEKQYIWKKLSQMLQDSNITV